MILDARPEQDAATLRSKVDFLSRAEAYPHPVDRVVCQQTHMSWVFLAGDMAYKLKKPVRFSYLDFSTIERREAACRAELRLNRRLAPDIYLDVLPLTLGDDGLAIAGRGPAVDWLVVMRRLDTTHMLDHALLVGHVRRSDIDRVAQVLTGFYRRARTVFPQPEADLMRWRHSLALNRRILLEPRFALPGGEIRLIDRAQRDFLKRHATLRLARIRAGYVRDGHGDLRPEHIYIGDTIRIIDCLEFSPQLRAVDPLDEVAYLSIECERLGFPWVGEDIKRRLAATLGRGVSDTLYGFYRCHRATLRARLAIAHLLEPDPRTPERWPEMAKAYLAIAARDAERLRQTLRTRASR